MSINLRLVAKISLAVAILLGAVHWWQQRPISHGPGVTAPNVPRQTEPVNPTPFVHRASTITPLAEYQLDARVLGVEPYRLDSGAALSPMDLALGWGPMSDESVLDQLTINQSARWFTWYANGPLPIPRGEIERHAANVHIVPANDRVEQRLAGLRVGQVIRLEGQLIKAERPGYRPWVSSLSRDDTGSGACELMWVERVLIGYDSPPLP